jgi:hypothetical protein
MSAIHKFVVTPEIITLVVNFEPESAALDTDEMAKPNGDSKDPNREILSAVYESMSSGFDFSAGISFAKYISKKFLSIVHPSRETCHFTMVVSFGRTSFHLSEEVVGFALEAVIGGYCGGLKVSYIAERVFSFVVSSKKFGFEILNLCSHNCPQFKCYFHLWGLGGPNWSHEFKQWQRECNEEWTLVSPSKCHMQMGLTALRIAKPKPAIKFAGKLDTLVKKKLSFASKLDYTACKGYKSTEAVEDKSRPSSSKTYWTTIEPSIPFGTMGIFPIHQQDKVSSHAIITEPNAAVCTDFIEGSSGLDTRKDLQGLEEVVNDIAFRFWKCSRCLSMSHQIESCSNEIRCRGCYRCGHKEKNCLNFGSKKNSVFQNMLDWKSRLRI